MGYQSWHSSTGFSAHCNRVLHTFLRYQYFCITTFNIMDFLSSPGTFLLLSLCLKLWAFISNFRKVTFQSTVFPLSDIQLTSQTWNIGFSAWKHLTAWESLTCFLCCHYSSECYDSALVGLLCLKLTENCPGITANLPLVRERCLRYRLKHYVLFICHLYNQRVGRWATLFSSSQNIIFAHCIFTPVCLFGNHSQLLREASRPPLLYSQCFYLVWLLAQHSSCLLLESLNSSAYRVSFR